MKPYSNSQTRVQCRGNILWEKLFIWFLLRYLQKYNSKIKIKKTCGAIYAVKLFICHMTQSETTQCINICRDYYNTTFHYHKFGPAPNIPDMTVCLVQEIKYPTSPSVGELPWVVNTSHNKCYKILIMFNLVTLYLYIFNHCFLY